MGEDAKLRRIGSCQDTPVYRGMLGHSSYEYTARQGIKTDWVVCQIDGSRFKFKRLYIVILRRSILVSKR